jgi:hypothetical protein
VFSRTNSAALHDVRPKAFQQSSIPIGEIGRGSVQQSSVAASISPALFFAPFFWASKRKESSIVTLPQPVLQGSSYN